MEVYSFCVVAGCSAPFLSGGVDGDDLVQLEESRSIFQKRSPEFRPQPVECFAESGEVRYFVEFYRFADSGHFRQHFHDFSIVFILADFQANDDSVLSESESLFGELARVFGHRSLDEFISGLSKF